MDQKKKGLICIAVAVVLSLVSDYIPLPIDDIIAVLIAAAGGKNLLSE